MDTAEYCHHGRFHIGTPLVLLPKMYLLGSSRTTYTHTNWVKHKVFALSRQYIIEQYIICAGVLVRGFVVRKNGKHEDEWLPFGKGSARHMKPFANVDVEIELRKGDVLVITSHTIL